MRNEIWFPFSEWRFEISWELFLWLSFMHFFLFSHFPRRNLFMTRWLELATSVSSLADGMKSVETLTFTLFLLSSQWVFYLPNPLLDMSGVFGTGDHQRDKIISLCFLCRFFSLFLQISFVNSFTKERRRGLFIKHKTDAVLFLTFGRISS